MENSIICKYIDYYSNIYSLNDVNIQLKLSYIVEQIKKYKKVAIVPSGYHARTIVDMLEEEHKEIEIIFYDEFRVGEKIGEYEIRDLKGLQDTQYLDYLYILNHDDKIIEKLYNKVKYKINIDKISKFNEDFFYKFMDNQSFDIKYKEKTIIFIAFSFPSPLLNIVMELKSKDINVNLLTLSETASFGESLFKYFDNIVFSDYKLLFSNIKKLNVQNNSKIIFIGNFVADHIYSLLIKKILDSQLSFYYYKYDLVDGFYCCKSKTPFKNNAHFELEKELGKKIWNIDEESKKELYNSIDGLIYRDSKSIFKKVKDKYNSSMKNLQIYPIPKMSNIIDNNQVLNGVISFVWLGHLSLEEGSFGPQNSLFDIVPNIVENGYEFHMYNISDHYKILNDKFLINIKMNKEMFFYHFPIVGENLLPVVSQYTYGFMVYNFDEFSQNMDFHKFTISTKLFTYINAELPIVISEEYEEMSNLVKKYNCGIVIKDSNLRNIDFSKYDYNQLKENVKCAKKSLEKERVTSIDKLIKFLDLED